MTAYYQLKVARVMRAQYWDIWKGISIIAVVIIHISTALLNFDTEIVFVYFRQLICFPVPLFLAFAGYFAVLPGSNTLRDGFIRNRISRLVPSYLLWSLITIALKQPTTLLQPLVFFEHLYLGTGIGIGYFVILLLQYTLITPLLVKISSTKTHLVLLFIFATIFLVFNYILRLFYPSSRLAQFPTYALMFTSWYPFYHFGIYASNKNLRSNPSFSNKKNLYLFSFFILLGLSFVESNLLWHLRLIEFSVSQMKLSSFGASFFLFLYILAAFKSYSESGSLMQYISWLGLHSYPIYLMHILCLSIVLFAWKKLHLIGTSSGIYNVFLLTILILTLISVFIFIVKLFFSPKLQKYILGM